MGHTVCELLGEISGYKQKYETLKAEYDARLGNPPVLTVREYRDINWMDTMIKRHLPGFFYQPLTDRYCLTNHENFIDVAIWDWIDKKPYLTSEFMCGHFTIAFVAHCYEYLHLHSAGIIIDWSSQHAYVLAVLLTGNPLLFEPQSDSLFSITERNRKLYGLEDGMVLI